MQTTHGGPDTGTTSTGTSQPGAPGWAGRPGASGVFERRDDDKALAGVAAAIGRGTGTDPVIYRVLFVVLVVVNLLGVVLYLFGLLLIPKFGQRSPANRVLDADWTRRPTVTVLALAGVAALVVTGTPGLVLGLNRSPANAACLAVVALIAYLVLRQHRPGRDPSGWGVGPGWRPRTPDQAAPASAATVVTPTATAAAAPKETVTDGATVAASGTATGYRAGAGTTDTYTDATDAPGPSRPADVQAFPSADPPGATTALYPGSSSEPYPYAGGPAGPVPPWAYTPSPLPPPPVPRARRSRLGRATLSAAVVVAGLLWLLTATGSIDLDAGQVLAVVVGVLGLGLVAGAWLGRARLLLPLGLLLAAASAVVMLLAPLGSDGVGDRTYAPVDPVALADGYQLGAGSLRLDLTGVQLAGATRAVEGRLRVGVLLVIVPPDVTLVVHAHAGIGQLLLPDQPDQDGTRVDQRVTIPPAATGLPDPNQSATTAATAGTGTYRLDLQVGIGAVEVRRG